WPVTDGLGLEVSDKGPNRYYGSLVGGGVTWSAPPQYLQERYMRIDVSPTLSLADHFRAGCLVVARALRPMIIMGSSLPTPIEDYRALDSWSRDRILVPG